MSELEIISIQSPEEKSNNNINKLKEHINSSNPSAIIYLMDGCPHCVDLKKILNQVEPELKKYKSKGGILGKLEQKYMDLINVENRSIDGFPTMIITKNGKQIEKFEGDRTKKDIIEFLIEQGLIEQGLIGTAALGGGKRKSHKVRKSRKSRKIRKGRKSRKSRKVRKSRKGKKSHKL